MEISTGLSDALTILGAAGIVIPAFARILIIGWKPSVSPIPKG
jgi:hypothetical protein